MNDPQIRSAFHNTFLCREHSDSTTRIVDELGIIHGKCRADIAVINGHMDGYEIKSQKDTLFRLAGQIEAYNGIFDHSSIILSDRHLRNAEKILPYWWGIVQAKEDKDGSINFSIIRDANLNETIDNSKVVQLLWRHEAQEILQNLGVEGRKIRENKSDLYRSILEIIEPPEVRRLVRDYLKNRKNWRHPV